MSPRRVVPVTRRTGPHPHTAIRLHPDGGTRYIEVLVWPTHRALAAHWRRSGAHHLDAAATCTEWLRWRVGPDGRMLRSRKVAEVNFHRGRLGTEVVTHEMFHATLAWGRRIRFDWARLGADDAVNADEERLAYVHGYLCREFVNVAHARGWYE